MHERAQAVIIFRHASDKIGAIHGMDGKKFCRAVAQDFPQDGNSCIKAAANCYSRSCKEASKIGLDKSYKYDMMSSK